MFFGQFLGRLDSGKRRESIVREIGVELGMHVTCAVQDPNDDKFFRKNFVKHDITPDRKTPQSGCDFFAHSSEFGLSGQNAKLCIKAIHKRVGLQQAVFCDVIPYFGDVYPGARPLNDSCHSGFSGTGAGCFSGAAFAFDFIRIPVRRGAAFTAFLHVLA